MKRNKNALELSDSKKIEKILAKHYDATCDMCSKHLSPSVEQIKAHYVQEHAMNGYVKCCNGIKLQSNDEIKKHVILHLHPEIHKWVIEYCCFLWKQQKKKLLFGLTIRRCAFCDSQFVRGNVLKSYDLIEKHLEKHLICEQKKVHMCIICRTRFASIELLNVHQKYHHGIGKFIIRFRYLYACLFNSSLNNFQMNLIQTIQILLRKMEKIWLTSLPCDAIYAMMWNF